MGHIFAITSSLLYLDLRMLRVWDWGLAKDVALFDKFPPAACTRRYEITTEIKKPSSSGIKGRRVQLLFSAVKTKR